MNNKDSIRGVYDELHAPDALFGKVMNMSKKESKKRNILRYAAGAVATLAIGFVASNGIGYAATGETWVTKAIVYINGEATEEEIEWHEEGDVVYGEMSIDVDDENASILYTEVVTDNAPDDFVLYTDEEGLDADGSDEEIVMSCQADIEEKDGVTYLNIGESSVDITEDFADGEATGTAEIDGVTYNFKVTGTVDNFNIELSYEFEDAQ